MALKLSKWTTTGVYFFALMLVCWPYFDLVSNAWPVQLGNVEWRYGFTGLMAAYHHTPILGVMLALALALIDGHQKMARGVAIFALVWCGVLILLAGMFTLDLLQVRDLRAPEVQGAILVGGAIAALKHLTAAIALFLLGMGAWTASKREVTKARSPGPGVVVGRS